MFSSVSAECPLETPRGKGSVQEEGGMGQKASICCPVCPDLAFKNYYYYYFHGVGYLSLSSFTFGTRVPLAQGSISWVSLCSAEHLMLLKL